MGHIEKKLLNDETILYRADISWKILVSLIVVLIFFTWFSSRFHPIVLLLASLYSIYLIIRVTLVILSTEFALTNRRIIAKKGFFFQHSIEILLNKVESISVSQPLIGRILGFGTVTIIGSGGTQEVFKSIDNPMELRKQVNDQIFQLSQNQ